MATRTPPPRDDDIRRTLLDLLARRAADATLCPSEVARLLADGRPGWRAWMPQVRAVAARLAGQGRVRVTQRGVEVDALRVAGPIRIGHGSGDQR